MKKNPLIKLFTILIASLLIVNTGCKKDEEVDADAAAQAAAQAAFDAANGVNGAQLYDHPLNFISASQTDYPNAYTNFFRCKSCHGWDLKGQSGVLINKASSATYPVAAVGNVYSWAHAHSITEVFAAVKKTGGRIHSDVYDYTHPDYGKLLTDAQIWDVVKFLKETSHNVDDFYDMSTTGTYPTGSRTFSNIGKNGDATAGLATYNAKCKVCHGTDGMAIDIYCQGLFLGEMFRHDPHEMHHKSVWGMPNDREHIDAGCTFAGPMPAVDLTDQDIRNLMVMGQDEVLFPEPGGSNKGARRPHDD